MSYETLIAEHARIDAALEALRTLTTAPAPDLPAVVIAISDLSRDLAEHLAHEDSFIYPRMIANGGAAAAVANVFLAEFAELRRDWGRYLGEWNTACIEADWDGFGRETEAMIERLAKRMRAANDLLYAVALRSGAIPPRDRRRAA